MNTWVHLLLLSIASFQNSLVASLRLRLKGDLECTYGLVASRRFLPGLVTLTSSLASDLETGDCAILLVWHPALPDTNLTDVEKAAISCASGFRPVSYLQADETRVDKYLAMNLPDNDLHSYGALLKQELFFMQRSSALIYVDSDMLALKRTYFVHEFLRREPQDTWQLHGSRPTKSSLINTGFMAFRTPVPEAFLNSLDHTFNYAVSAQPSLKAGDQDLINTALAHLSHQDLKMSIVYNITRMQLGSDDEHGRLPTVHDFETALLFGIEYSVAHSVAGDVQKWLAIHQDWFMNYRPVKGDEMSRWNVVHWSGCNKPWGAPGAFNQLQDVIPEMTQRWKESCMSVKGKCAASFQSSNVIC